MTVEGVLNRLIVMGAAGTLGSAFTEAARPFSREIFLYDRLENAAKDIRGCDLSSDAEVLSTIQEIGERLHGRVGIVLASGLFDGTTQPLTSHWCQTQVSLEINLNSLTRVAVEVSKMLVKNCCSGRVVIVSSAAARVGSEDIGYGVAKAGLDGLVRSLSKAFAKSGITSIGVAPGYFQSSMSARQSPERQSRAIASSHLGRAVDVDEVVKVLGFALFEAPDAMTGSILSVSAGQ